MSKFSKFRRRTSCLSSLTRSLSGTSSSDGGGDPLLFLLPLPVVRCLGRAGWPGTLTHAGRSHEPTSLHTASTGFWVRGLEEEVCRSREPHGSLQERLHANKDDQVDLLLVSTCSSVIAAPCRASRDAGGVRWRPSLRTHSCELLFNHFHPCPFGKVAVFLSMFLVKSRLFFLFLAPRHGDARQSYQAH